MKLLSSMAPRQVLAEAAALYAQRNSVEVVTLAAGGVDAAKRIESGEVFDIVVLASDAIAKLADSGKLSKEGRTDLMSSGIAIAVRSGKPHPDVSNEAAVQNAVLSAASLSYSTGPSGRYLEKLFERWGILATIRSRVQIPPPGIPVAELVAGGKAQLGFQQLSELINSPGIDVVGEMPEPAQLTTTFTAAICASCNDPATARRFISFVASPETDSIRERQGMHRPVAGLTG